MTTTKIRPKPHGRPPMPVGTHGKIDIRQIDSGSYEATCAYRDRDGTTRRIARRGPSKSKATARLQEALRERMAVGNTRLLPGSRYADVATLYLGQLDTAVSAGTLSPTTRAIYQHWLGLHILPRIGQLRLNELDVAALEDLLEDLPVGASSKRTCRTVLRSSLQLALRQRAIPHNPARELGQIRRGPGGRNPPRALTTEERLDLLAKLHADPHARRYDLVALVMFMLGTGVRIGEALAVRWCDLDLGGMLVGGRRVPVVRITGNLVHVRGQGLVRRSGKTPAATRTIALPQFVVALLRERKLRWTADDDSPLFPAEKVGSWRWPNNVQRAWRGVRRRAGYDWVTPHVFRKTASTELERMGLTVRQRGDVLGHANLTTTQDVYTHRGEVHPDAAAALDAAFGA